MLDNDQNPQLTQKNPPLGRNMKLVVITLMLGFLLYIYMASKGVVQWVDNFVYGSMSADIFNSIEIIIQGIITILCALSFTYILLRKKRAIGVCRITSRIFFLYISITTIRYLLAIGQTMPASSATGLGRLGALNLIFLLPIIIRFILGTVVAYKISSFISNSEEAREILTK